MKCYTRSSASSRPHDVDGGDVADSFAEGVKEFQGPYKALFVRC